MAGISRSTGKGVSKGASRSVTKKATDNGRGLRKQGASRRDHKPSIDWRGSVRLLVLWLKRGALLTLLGGSSYFGYIGVVAWLDKPVSSVKINGEFSRVSREAVAERVYSSMGNSFIKLDLQAIQASLRQEPWIDLARVERRWPNALEITVIEHKPIARWGDSDALNHRGEIIRLQAGAESAKLLQGLPGLFGGEGMEQEVMAQYQVISSLLKDKKMVVKRLTCDATRSWSLALQDDVVIEIGRDQVINRVKRLLTVYEAQLQVRWAELERVDLRYFNGLAVKWRGDVSA